MMTGSDKQILTQLQRGIEITSRPFSEEALGVLQRAQADGLLRRFGGVFDARRLGYKSILCALDVSDGLMEEKAAIISAHPGVTHCYERRLLDCRAGTVERAKPSRRAAGRFRSSTVPALQNGSAYPTLWFTLAMLHDEFDEGIKTLGSELGTAIYQLPAMRRFKIDVVFDLQTRNRDETFPGQPVLAADDEPFRVYTDVEKDLVRALDQQVPLVDRPFASVAEQIGQPEEWVLSTLNEWKEAGVIRRVGAVLYHRQAGFKANAMCVWPVADAAIAGTGRRMAARPEVTHCYQRPRLEVFPFDLYAMIHAGSWDETRALFEDISKSCGLSGGELFASGREFKKSSMKYFREE